MTVLILLYLSISLKVISTFGLHNELLNDLRSSLKMRCLESPSEFLVSFRYIPFSPVSFKKEVISQREKERKKEGER